MQKQKKLESLAANKLFDSKKELKNAQLFGGINILTTYSWVMCTTPWTVDFQQEIAQPPQHL